MQTLELFKPNKKEITSIRKWQIDTHEIRQIYVREDQSTYPDCCNCKKSFEYGDRYFYCLTDPIRIRRSGYEKVCFDCGIKLLSKMTLRQKFLNMRQLFLAQQ